MEDLTRVVISYEMTTSVNSVYHMALSNAVLSLSTRKRIVDTDVVSDVTCTYQNVITRVVIRFLLYDVIH